MIAKASRGVKPPTSGVPVPGAKVTLAWAEADTLIYPAPTP